MRQFPPEAFTGTFWTILDGSYYVSTIGNDLTGDGSPQFPYLTIAKAFEEAETNEKIVIGPDEYVAFDEQSSGGTELICKAATIDNINLNANPGGFMTIDTVQIELGDRVLVWLQNGPAENGVYILTADGWVRDPNFNSVENIEKGKLIPILEGAQYGKSIFQHTTTVPINVGSTALTFEKVAVTDWGELKGDLSKQSDLVSYVDLPSSYDLTVIVGPNEEETSPKNAGVTVRNWLDSNPDKKGRILIREGVYEENEINQHQVDIWAEDGAIVWSSVPARSILSDRHLGNNVELRVFGKGVFVHAAPSGSNDQQAINFRRPGAKVYVQAKTIDMPQMWSNSFQELTIEDCDFIFQSPGYSRSNSILVANNCRFLNGIATTGYNNGFSILKLRNVEIIIPKKIGQVGLEIRDKSDNLVVKLNTDWMRAIRIQNNTQQLAKLSGASGGGNFIIEGVSYSIAFDTSLSNSIENFISTHQSNLLQTSDEIAIRRVAGILMTGTSGSGTLTVEGNSFPITFDGSIAKTVKEFAINETPNLEAIGVMVKEVGDELIFTKLDSTRPVVNFSNVSGNLNSTSNDDQILFDSVQQVEFSAAFNNSSGDLDAQVSDYYTLQDLSNQVIDQRINRNGFVGVYKSHYHPAGGSEGRGQTIFLDDVLIRLQKRKTIGLKMVARVNEIPGRYGGLFANGVTIRDETGTGETVALVHGYDSSRITSPFRVELKGVQQNCGATTAVVSDFDGLDIKSNDPAFDTSADDFSTHVADLDNPHQVSKDQIGLGDVDNTTDLDKPISNSQQAALDLKADKANVIEKDNTTAYTPTGDYHPATKKFIEDQIATLDKATPKGLIDASTNPHYPIGVLGDYYYVSESGKVGGAQGMEVQIGDKVQCIDDDPTGGTQGSVGDKWIIYQGNLDKATTSEAQAGSDDEKYLTPLKANQGWDSWVNTQLVNELSTADQTLVGAINELQTASGNVFKVGTPVSEQLAVWTGDGLLAGTQYLLFEEDQLKTAFDITVGTDGGEGDGTLYLTRTNNGFAAIDFGESWSLRTYGGSGEGTDFGLFNTNSGEDVIFIESGNRITISDADGGLGAQYAGDYSSGNSANSRWIPDKGYVDNAIAGLGASNLQSVLNSGSAATIASSISTVSTGSNDFSFTGRQSGSEYARIRSTDDGEGGYLAEFEVSNGTLTNKVELTRNVALLKSTNGAGIAVGTHSIMVTNTGVNVNNSDFTLGGTSRINGYLFPTIAQDGSSGEVLTTDGAGGMSWQPASSSPINFGSQYQLPLVNASGNDFVYNPSLSYNTGTGVLSVSSAIDGAGNFGLRAPSGFLNLQGQNGINLTVLGSGTIDFNDNADFKNNLITNLTDPVNPQDAATKAYVDSNASGFTGSFTVDNASTNADVKIADFNRTTAGTASNGIGGYLAIGVEDASGAVRELSILHELAIATAASVTSNFQVRGLNSGIQVNFLRVTGGTVTLNPWGVTSIGSQSNAGSNWSTAIGANANTNSSAQHGVAIGSGASITNGDGAVSIGQNADVLGTDGIAIGHNARGLSVNSIGIGDNAGNTSGTVASGFIAIGQSAGAGVSNGSQHGIAIGTSTIASGSFSSIAIGEASQSSANYAVAIGRNSLVSSNEALAIGREAHAESSKSIAIGSNAGNTTGSKGSNFIAIGDRANAGSQNIGGNSIAIGIRALTGAGSIAIGIDAAVTVSSAVSIGTAITNNISNSFATYGFKVGTTYGTGITADANPDVNLTNAENGVIAYDSTNHEFRAFINGGWQALVGSGGGLTNLEDSSSNVVNSSSGTGYFQWDSIRIDASTISAIGGFSLSPGGSGVIGMNGLVGLNGNVYSSVDKGVDIGTNASGSTVSNRIRNIYSGGIESQNFRLRAQDNTELPLQIATLESTTLNEMGESGNDIHSVLIEGRRSPAAAAMIFGFRTGTTSNLSRPAMQWSVYKNNAVGPVSTGELYAWYNYQTKLAALDALGNWDFRGNLLKNLANPVDSQDAATKAYVDANVDGQPAGLNNQIQFNNNGSFGASSSLRLDPVAIGTNLSIGLANGSDNGSVTLYGQTGTTGGFLLAYSGGSTTQYASLAGNVSGGPGLRSILDSASFSSCVVGDATAGNDTGDVPLVRLIGRIAGSAISTRPVLGVMNGSDLVASVEANGNWDFKGNLLKNLADPVDAQDAATKAYVDANVGGEESGENSSLLIDDISSGLSLVSLNSFFFTRIDNIVTFSCKLLVNPTALGPQSFSIELPISSNFTASTDASASGSASSEDVGAIRAFANSSTDKLFVGLISNTTTGSRDVFLTGHYIIK